MKAEVGLLKAEDGFIPKECLRSTPCVQSPGMVIPWLHRLMKGVCPNHAQVVHCGSTALASLHPQKRKEQTLTYCTQHWTSVNISFKFIQSLPSLLYTVRFYTDFSCLQHSRGFLCCVACQPEYVSLMVGTDTEIARLSFILGRTFFAVRCSPKRFEFCSQQLGGKMEMAGGLDRWPQ